MHYPPKVAYIAVLTLLQVVSCVVGARGQDISWQDLSSAHEQWMELAEFKSTFTYTEGIATAVPDEDGLRVVDKVLRLGRGVFHKKGSLIRHSISFDKGPRIVGKIAEDGSVESPPEDAEVRSAPGEKIMIQDGSEDEAYDSSRVVTYNPKWGRFYDTATFSRRSDIFREPGHRACTSTEKLLSPLNPIAGCALGFSGSPAAAANGSGYSTEILQNGRILLSFMSVNSDEKSVDKYVVEWSTEPDIPVIVRIRREAWSDSKLRLFVESVLSGFVITHGVSVAKQVQVVIGSGNGGAVEVRTWKSEDLGNDQPVDEDFIITIAESTKVVGLKKPLPEGSVRRLNLVEVQVEDILGLGDAAGTKLPGAARIQPERTTSRNISSTRWLIAANVGAVIAAAFFFVWRRRRTSTSA